MTARRRTFCLHFVVLLPLPFLYYMDIHVHSFSPGTKHVSVRTTQTLPSSLLRLTQATNSAITASCCPTEKKSEEKRKRTRMQQLETWLVYSSHFFPLLLLLRFSCSSSLWNKTPVNTFRAQRAYTHARNGRALSWFQPAPWSIRLLLLSRSVRACMISRAGALIQRASCYVRGAFSGRGRAKSYVLSEVLVRASISPQLNGYVCIAGYRAKRRRVSSSFYVVETSSSIASLWCIEMNETECCFRAETQRWSWASWAMPT